MSGIDALLERIRTISETSTEKGNLFEDLIAKWLVTDPLQKQECERVQRWADWAREHGYDIGDIGIDLVATPRAKENKGKFIAIQCKNYRPERILQAGDIDSFLACSSNHEKFCMSLFIDTTERNWSANARIKAEKLSTPLVRISLHDLRKSACDWDAIDGAKGDFVLPQKEKKKLRPYQQKALEGVCSGFENNDRGQLIMACGTGKTIVALKIAEKIAGKGKRILFLAPSLSLVSQTMREWANDAETALRSFAVCSDTTVADRKTNKDPENEIDDDIHDIAFPVTTDALKLANNAKDHDNERMTVVFATYQSLDKIHRAQEKGLQDFDLVVCDEAHKTTGVVEAISEDDKKNKKLKDKKSSSRFTDIHEQVRVNDKYEDYIKGKKRLFMTATPKIYGVKVKSQSVKEGMTLYGMDNEKFGDVFFSYSFGDAVKEEVLSKYEVVVLTMDKSVIEDDFLKSITEKYKGVKVDDATRIIGCYKALQDTKNWYGFKQKKRIDLNGGKPLQKVIAFCRSILSSKFFSQEFDAITKKYLEQISTSNGNQFSSCEVRHVDGTNTAKERNEQLHWLGGDVENKCRILSNARCLTEGIDVPSLDAVIFLHARKSQVDIVQSVGRVMRKLKGKEKGYVILPVVVSDVEKPDQEVRNNKAYEVVWQVLNALKSHDNRLENSINNAELSDNIFNIWRNYIYIVPDLSGKKEKNGYKFGDASADDGAGRVDRRRTEQLALESNETLIKAVRPILVEQCGSGRYYKKWGVDIATIAKSQLSVIKHAFEKDKEKKAVFDKFLKEIRDGLNNDVTEDSAIEMLSQHLITKPVFDKLFSKGKNFIEMNVVSKAMQRIVEILYSDDLVKQATKNLSELYFDIGLRTADLKNIHHLEGKERNRAMKIKQDLIRQLYDDFFRSAFPAMSKKLGIAYTPTEVVDFIIHSTNYFLKKEFKKTLGSEGVHIIDPFTGTGTFVTRLLQSGLIEEKNMLYKYKNEIHANEIVLLAYYIASINIEDAYQGIVGGRYTPFEGICLTDTFAMQSKDDLVEEMMPDNSKRRRRQNTLNIKVIIGNPPYRIGQKKEGDNAPNTSYPELDQKIKETYVAKSKARRKSSLYDSYIRSIRWASDRLGGNGGIVGFVTNNNWLDSISADGMRECLEEECSSLHIINLRGKFKEGASNKNSNTEGSNIFGVKVGVSIVFLVKNPKHTGIGKIFYYDISKEFQGNIKTKEDKLAFLLKIKSVKNLIKNNKFSIIKPNNFHDWIIKRDISIDSAIKIGNKKNKDETALFENYTLGVGTNKDAWCYNPSRKKLEANISRFIREYNLKLDDWKENSKKDIDFFIAKVKENISFTRSLQKDFKEGKPLSNDDGHFAVSSYRPFCKQWLFFSCRLNEQTYQNFRIFPTTSSNNRTINIAGKNHQDNQFGIYMVDTLSDLNFLPSGAQCFPIALYKKSKQKSVGDSLPFNQSRQTSDSITCSGLKHFQDFYDNKKIGKEDLFYYVYAVLHSKNYRKKYAKNLNKKDIKIPAVGKENFFWTLSKAGKELGDLHIRYEEADMYSVEFTKGCLEFKKSKSNKMAYFRVNKMIFGNLEHDRTIGKGKKKEKDLTTIHYNTNISITGIPLRAYDYIISGKSAIKWVMEYQCVRDKLVKNIGKDMNISDIEPFISDANDFANETMGDPAYPLKLLLRVITVSLKTLEIVDSLPEVEV